MDICRRRFGACILGGLAGHLLAASRPKVLLFVILEQFRLDYIEAAVPQLAAGGFRRLMEKGAWFPGCRNLASTFTASSLATLATGAWPAEHGIVADRWYDRSARRAVPASDEMLLATTLAAQVAADSRSSVSVIGLDSAQARLFAGTPDADVYWMDDDGQFAMRGEAPDWLAAFNQQHSAAKLHDQKWQAIGARPDAPPLRTLTFDEKHPEQFLALYQASPFAQDAQFDLAGEVIKRDLAFQGPGVHFVCLLAGSMARLGYETGAHSPLMQQMTLRLDQRLEALLAQLGHEPGDANFAVALAGAHGAPPAPSEETWRRMAVDGKTIADPVNQSLASAGLGKVEKYVYPFLYLDSSGFRDPEPIRLAAARRAIELPDVAGFYTAGGACSAADEWSRRYRNSFHIERSGDVMLSYRPEYVEDFGAGRGISYGSLYNYDACVPLAFLGPPFRPGVCQAEVELVDIAPTLARVLEVSPPSSSVGRALAEALA